MDKPPSIYSILFCIFISALFASFETAVSSIDKLKVKVKANEGSRLNALLLRYVENLDRTISDILILTNISQAAYSALITMYVSSFAMKYVGISIFLSAVVIFITGEMLPKVFAYIFKDRLAIICALFSYPLMLVIRPVSSLFYYISKAFSSKIAGQDENTVKEENIIEMVDDAIEDGNLRKETGELVGRALQFDDRTVANAMQKWEKTSVIYKDCPNIYEEAKKINYSRIPILSRTDGKLCGLIIKKMFLQKYIAEKDNFKIEDAISPPYFIRPEIKTDDALQLMSKNRVHFAFVKAEGKIIGIITVEDILEELMGEIKDEEDV